MEKKTSTCCICGKEIARPAGENNPWPLASTEEVCCGECNSNYVIPARMARTGILAGGTLANGTKVDAETMNAVLYLENVTNYMDTLEKKVFVDAYRRADTDDGKKMLVLLEEHMREGHKNDPE